MIHVHSSPCSQAVIETQTAQLQLQVKVRFPPPSSTTGLCRAPTTSERNTLTGLSLAMHSADEGALLPTTMFNLFLQHNKLHYTVVCLGCLKPQFKSFYLIH